MSRSWRNPYQEGWREKSLPKPIHARGHQSALGRALLRVHHSLPLPRKISGAWPPGEHPGIDALSGPSLFPNAAFREIEHQVGPNYNRSRRGHHSRLFSLRRLATEWAVARINITLSTALAGTKNHEFSRSIPAFAFAQPVSHHPQHLLWALENWRTATVVNRISSTETHPATTRELPSTRLLALR